MKFTAIVKMLPPVRRGAYLLEPSQRRLRVRDQEFSLTPVQVLLVRALIEEPALTTPALWQKVWGSPIRDDFTWRNTVNVNLHFLRGKLGPLMVRGGSRSRVTWQLVD